MKVSNRELLNRFSILTIFKEKELPISIKYAISKNIIKFSTELKAYEEEKNKLVYKYAEKDEDGKNKVEDNNFVIKDVENWEKDINELLDIEIDTDIHIVKEEAIMQSDLSVDELISLDFMIL